MKRISRIFLSIDNLFASLSLILIVGVTVVGVFMRFVVGEPLKWTEEMTIALFIWFTFLGASVVTKEDGHVGIDYFVEKFSPRLKRGTAIFRLVFLLFLNLYVFVYLGSQLMLQATTKLTPILRISYLYIDVAVVLCGLFGAIHLVLKIASLLKADNVNALPVNETSSLHVEPKREARA